MVMTRQSMVLLSFSETNQALWQNLACRTFVLLPKKAHWRSSDFQLPSKYKLLWTITLHQHRRRSSLCSVSGCCICLFGYSSSNTNWSAKTEYSLRPKNLTEVQHYEFTWYIADAICVVGLTHKNRQSTLSGIMQSKQNRTLQRCSPK